MHISLSGNSSNDNKFSLAVPDGRHCGFFGGGKDGRFRDIITRSNQGRPRINNKHKNNFNVEGWKDSLQINIMIVKKKLKKSKHLIILLNWYRRR